MTTFLLVTPSLSPWPAAALPRLQTRFVLFRPIASSPSSSCAELLPTGSGSNPRSLPVATWRCCRIPSSLPTDSSPQPGRPDAAAVRHPTQWGWTALHPQVAQPRRPQPQLNPRCRVGECADRETTGAAGNPGRGQAAQTSSQHSARGQSTDESQNEVPPFASLVPPHEHGCGESGHRGNDGDCQQQGHQMSDPTTVVG